MFKIGDKIKYSRGIPEDTIYVITDILPSSLLKLEGYTDCYDPNNFDLVESILDPDIDVQWIPEEQLFVIDGIKITPEALKILVHSCNDKKTPEIVDEMVALEDLITRARGMYG